MKLALYIIFIFLLVIAMGFIIYSAGRELLYKEIGLIILDTTLTILITTRILSRD